MRPRYLASVILLMLAHATSFAQVYGTCPVLPPCGLAESSASAPCRVSGEYLLWWLKPGRVPPLVTGGGNGVLGAPGTRVLLDDLDFTEDVRQGGRFTCSYQLPAHSCLGLSASGFFLVDRLDEVRYSERDATPLGRPFFNLNTNSPDALLVVTPGSAVGTISVQAHASLWGVEANLTWNLIDSDCLHVMVLGGGRYLRLEDQLTISDPFLTFGNRVGLFDDFRVVNQFYGGQAGLQAGVSSGSLSLDLQAKVALGPMHQQADVNGALHRVAPDGAQTSILGGLFALRSNIGRHVREEFALVPEVNLNLGWQVTPRLRITAGYALLWLSNVARAGEQIDPVINTTQFPLRSGTNPLVGSARPAFHFQKVDFWAQGVTFGLELRY